MGIVYGAASYKSKALKKIAEIKDRIQYLKTRNRPIILKGDFPQDVVARKIAIKTMRMESHEFRKHNYKMPSSVIQDMMYIDKGNDMGFLIIGFGSAAGQIAPVATEYYTYMNVPESVFLRFEEGLATCITDDSKGSLYGGIRKRWVAGKSPSLGAFFNKYIKNRFQFVRGKVYI